MFAALCAATLMTEARAANPRYAGIVVDMDNGEVLYAENADARRYPASLTKMMTLYLTFEALVDNDLSLEQPLKVSGAAAAMPASKLWLAKGSTITVDKAIRALTVKSANDVAVVLAEAVGGSEERFARKMTQKARELGMHDTTFRNASGLPDSQQATTARDLLTLAVHVMQDFPQYYHYFGLQTFAYRGKTHSSHNRLVKNYPGADGLKTGFIRASGFNVATTAVHDGRRMVGVVMGGFSSKSRDTHMTDLLDRSFARSTLRDRGTWLADTRFSQEFMAFGGLVSPDKPTQTDPRSLRPMLAAVDTVEASAPPAASRPKARSTFEPERRPAPREATADNDDPLEPLMADATPAVGDAAGGWGIQVGAFSEQASARRLANQAANQLSGGASGKVSIDALDGPEQVFRARLVALGESQARQACQRLKANGMDCMVVNASL
ncbi:D-alanyl-D-alanine carboxypeptidase [Halomonas garicola]|uniref:D-alanyl-D-alanine carboxypeptidase n=1 Tax=Halomonas garicola TaxID=1690008 RepID=UPI0028978AB4|nr:D-alanyl-D-alanine carboxypeptidase [Halomonas garicola]